MTTRSAEAKSGVLPIPKPEPQPKGRRDRERPALYTYACLPEEVPSCWLAQFSDVPCSGRLERAHLIRKQTVRREVSRSNLILWDPRILRFACRLHHGQLDYSRTLVIPRSALPASVEEFAAEHSIDWWLTRRYGERPA